MSPRNAISILGTLSFPLIGLLLGGNMLWHRQSIEVFPQGDDFIIKIHSKKKDYFKFSGDDVSGDDGRPITSIKTPKGKYRAFIVWSYDFGKDYPPEKRGSDVTARLNKYFSQCSELKVTHRKVPGNNGGEIPTIFVDSNENKENCRGMVYNLKYESDGEKDVNKLQEIITKYFSDRVNSNNPISPVYAKIMGDR